MTLFCTFLISAEVQVWDGLSLVVFCPQHARIVEDWSGLRPVRSKVRLERETIKTGATSIEVNSWAALKIYSLVIRRILKILWLSFRWYTTTATEGSDSPSTEAAPRRQPGSLVRLWNKKAKVRKLACERSSRRNDRCFFYNVWCQCLVSHLF